ncbi:bifunctional Armadillo-type fold/Armadillo-like helical/Condensin complex subunit 3 [Babesia duncani]|uniref:Bifunctional Armadillo-type fold/Armadillo-like helical/Condensin complex subunit 3 n=1 Tax=Babesia duncani TaxID=323732 RepID=A0AAD9PMY2_9APIC|nr:bifunctional Armadillo-type fold/Armadillo-like helical/Condensin complex subunit 3 [Babesia duncani]
MARSTLDPQMGNLGGKREPKNLRYGNPKDEMQKKSKSGSSKPSKQNSASASKSKSGNNTSAIMKMKIFPEKLDKASLQKVNDLFTSKLEFLQSHLVSTMARVHEKELGVDAGISTIAPYIREMMECIFNYDLSHANVALEDASYYVFNDLLLCLIYLAKLYVADPSQDVKPLTIFVYQVAMRMDVCIECIITGNALLPDDAGIDDWSCSNSNLVLQLWQQLLILVTAKDRKLMAAFCTVTFFFVNIACANEIGISEELYKQHVDTFIQLSNDMNNEVRCRSIQLLENFQDERVCKEMIARLLDPNASVRAVSVSCLAIPEEIEQNAPTLRLIIARISDVSPEVRIEVYRKLSELYNDVPVELVIQILCFGLAEQSVQVREAFITMLTGWMESCGDLLAFVADVMSQAEDLMPLEAAISFYMTEVGIVKSFKTRNDKKKKHNTNNSVDTTLENYWTLISRFKTLNPSELFIVMVFLLSNNEAQYTKVLDIVDIVSYLHFLLKLHYSALNKPKQTGSNEKDLEGFSDAMEVDESSAIYTYTKKEIGALEHMYQGDTMSIHALRMLLVIAHYHPLDNPNHISLLESICDKILLHGPARQMFAMLISSVVIQTSLGNNSPSHFRPSRWLKPGFVFAATSLIRYMHTRISINQNDVVAFETTVTRKILSIITDIKDPFQVEGANSLWIRRDAIEKMDFAALEEFDADNYSIEHLNMFDTKLTDIMEQVETQLKELDAIKASRKNRESNIEKGVLSRQQKALNDLAHKLTTLLKIIRDQLRDRWTRILVIIESFLVQTRSTCENDSGLSEFPSEILLPQLTFFCSKVVQWQQQTIVDQYCDVISSKCLGTWCIVNNSIAELNKQLNAFHIALKGTLGILEGFLNTLEKESNDSLCQRIEIQTLRCEMYITTLTDLLVTRSQLVNTDKESVADQDLYSGTLVTIWSIVTGNIVTSKYIQSITIRACCKLSMVEILDYVNSTQMDINEAYMITSQRIRGLLELAFVAPSADRSALSNFKFIKNTVDTNTSPEDKECIVSTFTMYLTLSHEHLQVFHHVLEQVLMRSIMHAMQFDINHMGFSNLIQYMVQTILHKAPLEFTAKSYCKYIKWMLLVSMDIGPTYAIKVGLMSLMQSLFTMFASRNISKLLAKLAPVEFPSNVGKTLFDACFWFDPKQTALDLRDIRVLIQHLLTSPEFQKKRSITKPLTEILNVVMRLYPRNESHAPKDSNDHSVLLELVDVYDTYVAAIGPRHLVALLSQNQIG